MQLSNFLDLQSAAGELPCQSAPDLFFAMEETTSYVTVAGAKLLCSTCPIREACASYAIAAEEEHGIWGGLTAGERKLMRRSRRRDLACA